MNAIDAINEFMRPAITSTRRHKVFVITPKDFLACVRGEKRIFNLPKDAEPLSFSCLAGRREVGLLVSSSSFEAIGEQQRAPCVHATMEKIR